MPPVIILLNGPRRSGKDTAADAILRQTSGWYKLPLADEIKRSTLALHGLDVSLLPIYESMKDEPLAELAGLSWRDLVIDHGNDMRTKHGGDYWTKQWINTTRMHFDIGAAVVLMSDCRFQFELHAAKTITPEVLLLRTYRAPGLHHAPNAWAGDIGSWLMPDVADCAQAALINDGPIEDLQSEAFLIARAYYKNVQRRHASAAI